MAVETGCRLAGVWLWLGVLRTPCAGYRCRCCLGVAGHHVRFRLQPLCNSRPGGTPPQLPAEPRFCFWACRGPGRGNEQHSSQGLRGCVPLRLPGDVCVTLAVGKQTCQVTTGLICRSAWQMHAYYRRRQVNAASHLGIGVGMSLGCEVVCMHQQLTVRRCMPLRTLLKALRVRCHLLQSTLICTSQCPCTGQNMVAVQVSNSLKSQGSIMMSLGGLQREADISAPLPGGLHQLIRLGGSLHASLRMGLRMLMRVLVRLVCQLLRLCLRLRMCQLPPPATYHHLLMTRRPTYKSTCSLPHCAWSLLSSKSCGKGLACRFWAWAAFSRLCAFASKVCACMLRLHLEGPRRRILALKMQAACVLLHTVAEGSYGTHGTDVLCNYPDSRIYCLATPHNC